MSKALQIVAGVVLIVAGAWTNNPALIAYGAGLALGAVLTDDPKQTQRLHEQKVMVRSGVKPQELVLGRDHKSGVIPWYGTSGAENRYLWFVIAVAEHEIEGYETLRIEGVDIDIATEIDGSGFVTKSDFIDADGNNLVKTKFYTGTDSQVADSELVAAFTDWTTDHKGEGVAYFWVRCEIDRSEGGNDPDNPSENVWHKGHPRDIAVTLKGAKVYDPRLDSTNGGTGSHRADDDTTWEWSENSILNRVHYLRSSRFGPGYLSTEVKWDIVRAEADKADTLVSIPNSETQKQYTLNGVVNVDDTPKEIIGALQSADHGTTLFHADGIEVRVGAWNASSHTIDESWLAGPVSMVSANAMDDNYNAVRGRFTDAGEDYAVKEFPPKTSAAYETEDSVGRVWKDIVLPYTKNTYAAQRLAIHDLKASRQQNVVDLVTNFRGELVKVWDVVTLNLADFSGDTFRVIGKSGTTEETITLQLREEVSTDWDYTIPELAEPPVIPSVVRYPDGVPAPTNLIALSGPEGIRLVWSHPSMSAISHIEVYAAATNDRSGAALVHKGLTESYFHPLTEGDERYYWVIARGMNGMLSQWYPVSDTAGVMGTAGGVADGEDAVLGYLSNESHTVAADNDGTGYSLTGAGGTFHVFDGITDVTGLGPTYSTQATNTKNGLTINIDSATGVYTLTGASWTSDQEQFVLRASYNGLLIKRTYTISKSKAGDDGTPAKLVTISATSQYFSYDEDDVLQSADQIDFTANQEGSTATVNWKTQYWNGSAWVDTATNRVSPTTGLTTTLLESAFDTEAQVALRVLAEFTDGDTYTDSVTVIKVRDGAPGVNSVIGYLSNESHTVAADADGTGYSLTGSGGRFHVFDGVSDVTGLGPNYDVFVTDTKNGLTISIDATTGLYNLSGTSWTSDQENFTLRAIYNGVTIKRVYTISKSKAGDEGEAAKLLTIAATGQIFAYDESGTLKSADTIDFTASQEGSTATVNWKTQRWNGSAWVDTTTNRVSPTTGLSSALTEAAFDAEGEVSLRVLAEFTDGSTYSDAITVIKVQDGIEGLSVAELSIYRRASSTPSTPSGGSYNFGTLTLTPPTNWSSSVPSGDDPVYISRGVASVQGTTGTDPIISWSAPVQVLANGESVDIIFRRSATQPTTPSPSSGTPSGWYTDVNSVPAGGDPLWSSVGTRANAGQDWTWQTPVKIEGDDGADGTDPIVSQLTNPSPVVQSESDGTGYSLTNAGGTHLVAEGTTDRTSSATHSVVGGSGSPSSKTQNGLTLQVSSSGVYSFSGSSWTSDYEVFTLRAVYGGVTNDKTITITKAKEGAGGSGTPDVVSLQSVSTNVGSGTTTQGFRVHSDGTVDATSVSSGSYTNQYTWLNSGTNSDYEVKMVKIGGQSLSSGTLDSWLACSTTRTWDRTAPSGSWVGQLTIRKASTGEILDSCTVELDNQLV